MTRRFGTEGTPDLPAHQIRVDGEELASLVQGDVFEIDVFEEINRHSRLGLLVQNWDPGPPGKVRYSDEDVFAPGGEIEVLIGYHSELAQVFSGVITAVSHHFPAKQQPVMQVEARSKSVLLDHPNRSRVFEETSDGDVAIAIAADYGLGSDAETGATRPFVVADRQSDWTHLVERAERLGWVVYVRDGTLVYRRPAGPVEPVEVEYGLNVTELQLTEDLTRLADPVARVGWDVAGKEPVEAEAGPSQADVEVGDRADYGESLSSAGWPLRREVDASSAAATAEDADLLAVGRVRQMALGHVSGTGSLVGNAAMRADSWISITGVGERMSGPHYLSSVRHRISNRGFTTEFQVGLPPRLLPPEPQRASAGLLIGVVEDLDDKRKWGRAKVGFPWRTDAPEAVWARLATLDAGPKQGTFFLPDVGQEVVVSLVEGDSAEPVILGSLWSGVQAPPITVDPEHNSLRAIVSRSGHRLVFNDDDQDGSILIETDDGNKVAVSDKDGSITLEEKESHNSLTLSSKGIEIKAVKGDITLSASAGKVKLRASGIEGKSTGPAKLESAATLDLKASATLGISGSLVNIN